MTTPSRPTSPPEPLPLYGFAGANYRSLHGPLQVVGPLDRINLLVGLNNAGKSNLLHLAARLLDAGPHGAYPEPTGDDRPRLPSSVERADPAPFAAALAIPTSVLRRDLVGIASHDERWPEAVDRLLEAGSDQPSSAADEPMFWFRYGNRGPQPAGSVPYEKEVPFDPDWLAGLMTKLSGSGAVGVLVGRLAGEAFVGTQDSQALAQILFNRDLRHRRVTVRTVDVDRRITAVREPRDGDPGAGLIAELASWRRPSSKDPEYDLKRRRFLAVQDFVRQVLADDTVQLDTDEDKTELQVEQNGVTLPVQLLGSGISHVIMLAATATAARHALILLEEPEAHLHPTLQRQLIRYLDEHTDNQYLIATHSAHLLDYEPARIFRVWQDEQDGTRVRPTGRPADVAEICHELGYRPSDLLQANAVIWVEGPTDRLYVKHWLHLAAPYLVEGQHYAVMFYGGRLLNHLSVADDEVSEFIALRRINRHAVVLIDSDRQAETDEIYATKRRVVDEFSGGGPGFAWVTAGRTIENYLPKQALHAAAQQQGRTSTWNGSRWDDPVAVADDQKLDKVRLARDVCRHEDLSLLEPLDLQDRLPQLIDLLRSANHPQVPLPPPR